MNVFEAIDAMDDDVLKGKCRHAIAAIQRTFDLFGCGIAAVDLDPAARPT